VTVGERLAELLSSQLADVVPPDFAMSGGDGNVTIVHGPSPLQVHVSAIVDDAPDSEESIADASFAVLSGVQDYIVRVLGEPWPSAPQPTQLPSPVALWEGDRLRLLYGDVEHPAQALPGIRRVELWS
jgi:hypothetical protein